MIGFGRFSYCALAIVQISGAGAALAAAPDVAADRPKWMLSLR